MKKLAISALTLGILSFNAYAIPGIDLKVGVGYTKLSPSGYVNYDGDNADVKGDLNWGDSGYAHGYVVLGLPIIPNIKVEYLKTKFEGTGTVNKTIKFGDLTFPYRDRVYSIFDVNQYDLSLYYNIPIPFIKPRIGLGAKYLDGYIYAKSLSTQQDERVDLNIPVPYVYGGLNVKIPLLPLEADVEGKGITYNGSYMYDIKATGKLVITKLPLIGKAYVGGGYRYQRYRLKDIDIDGKKLNTDIKFKGPFVELGVEF